MESIIYNIAIWLPGFLLAIVAHEWAHAFVALKFGDDTAKINGRLTFDPQAHIDIFGTVVLPLLLVVSGFGMFGYAKPVPIDPRRFSHYRKGVFWVSFAGPLMNVLLGLLSGFFLAILTTQASGNFEYYQALVQILTSSVYINFVLAIFNLIPFPPLDGSRMVSSFLDYETMQKYEGLQRFSLIFFIGLAMTGSFGYLLRPVFGLVNHFIVWMRFLLV